jgi:putative zinc finger/helix-turn-helix YgiT family protein
MPEFSLIPRQPLPSEFMKSETPQRTPIPESQERQVCPNCGSQEMQTHWMNRSFPHGTGSERVDLTGRVPLRTCSKCGLQFWDEEAEDLQHEAVCRHLGVLTPAEISELREKYGLSRAEFARLTKLGEATIARWERGELIQNAANDLYLRLLSHEDNLARLKASAHAGGGGT